MDILDDMGVSKLSAKVLFFVFFKVNYSFKFRYWVRDVKYCHAEKGINMCFIHSNKVKIVNTSENWTLN